MVKKDRFSTTATIILGMVLASLLLAWTMIAQSVIVNWLKQYNFLGIPTEYYLLLVLGIIIIVLSILLAKEKKEW